MADYWVVSRGDCLSCNTVCIVAPEAPEVVREDRSASVAGQNGVANLSQRQLAQNAELLGALRGKLILAPLTRGGNLPFRRLCADFGAEVLVSEMVFARQVFFLLIYIVAAQHAPSLSFATVVDAHGHAGSSCAATPLKRPGYGELQMKNCTVGIYWSLPDKC